MHAPSHCSAELILLFLDSLSSIGHLLPKKREGEHSLGAFSQLGHQLLEGNTISSLSILHGLHAAYILKDYQHYYYWYVYLLSLKVLFLLFLQISYILGPFGTTLFCMQILFIFLAKLKHQTHKHIIKTQ